MCISDGVLDFFGSNREFLLGIFNFFFFFEKSLVHIGHLTDFFGLLSME